jgi:hypothetical protein
VPHDRLVEALLEEAAKIAAEIRASGGDTEGSPTILKGAARRQSLLQPEFQKD